MKIVPRLLTGFVAFALVIGGLTAFAPSRAQAAEGSTIVALGIFAAAAVAAFVLIDEEGDDEAPQSP